MRYILESRVCDRPVVREQCKANLNILKVNSFQVDVSILSPLEKIRKPLILRFQGR